MTTTPVSGTALVTGASSGIGAVYADRLAKRGYHLILVARNQQRLARLARRLQAESGRSVEPIVADLTDKEDLERVETRLRTDPAISVLVNNAGIGATAPLLEADVEKMEAMIRLNVTALTRLTYAAAPGFVARGGGTIINIASVVALWPERLNGVYGATKAFVLGFSQSLQHELGDKSVRIQAVLPGATATEFWDLSGLPLHNLPSAIVMSAEDLVDAALTGLDQGEVITIPALPEKAEWDRYEATRLAMTGHLSNALPAPRYAVGQTRSAVA
ncbi:MAG: SDR family oxidoreductase [Alphaproteobacteria bacterium]|nr:SDR family oxidoreductase [Alphaproteobacteria bacterium]